MNIDKSKFGVLRIDDASEFIAGLTPEQRRSLLGVNSLPKAKKPYDHKKRTKVLANNVDKHALSLSLAE
jgi:hypothetical protein